MNKIKIKKIYIYIYSSWVQWYTPVVSATQEPEMGRSLEHRSPRPAF
jgi:hypothetical protein